LAASEREVVTASLRCDLKGWKTVLKKSSSAALCAMEMDEPGLPHVSVNTSKGQDSL